MSGNTYLSAEHTPFAYLGRTCDAHLGSHDGMRTYFIVVGYLDQIVQLYSAMNNGCSHGCTVDASIGADFYIVFQDNNTDLGNFFVSLWGRGKTETVCSDHASRMQNTVITYPAIMVYSRVGVQDTIAAYLGTTSHSGMRMNHCVVSYFRMITDASERSYIYVFSYFSGFRYIGTFVNTGSFGFAHFIQIEQLGKALVSIVYFD